MPRRQRQLGFAIALPALATIGLLTLLPTPEGIERAAETPLACVLCGDLGSVDFLLNILLFVPLGVGLALAGFSWRRVIILAAIATTTIELLQMKVITGRDASLGDLLANTLGAALGALLAAHWRGLVFPCAPRARQLALAYALGLLWIWAGTAWALGPAYPQGTRWFGAWAPELGNFEQFTGTVLMVHAGGDPLLPGPALDQGRFEDAVTAQPSLTFSAILNGPTDGLAPIGFVVDERGRDVMLIGQNGDDLEFGAAMRASIVKLRTPTATLPRGLRGRGGDTVVATGAVTDHGFKLTARNGQRMRSRRLPLSASWGWALVAPWSAALGEEVHALTALWILGLVALLAYWSARAGGGVSLIPPATAALLLGAVPYLAEFPPAHWSEWVAVLAGIALGRAAAKLPTVTLGTSPADSGATLRE